MNHCTGDREKLKTMAKVGSLEEEKALAVEIRKLRKKLRQIENLEVLDRPLNSEEQEKVNLIDRKSATCPFIQARGQIRQS